MPITGRNSILIANIASLGIILKANIGLVTGQTFLRTPEVISRPSISSGGTNIGDLQTATSGTYTNSPTSYIREWRRNGVAISGATSLTYVLTSDDQGAGLSFWETPVNAAGSGIPQRATTGNPRQFFISGDSLWSHSIITDDLQAALGTDWEVINIAHSGDHISPGTDANSMEAKAQSSLDPIIDKGWGVSYFHEYANQVNDVQGTSSGADTFSLLEGFGQARQAAGAGVVITSTCYYRALANHPNPSAPFAKNSPQAHIASELTRANFATHSDGFVDLDQNSYLASADEGAIGDGVHWAIGTDSTLRADVIARIVAKITELGLVGDGGDIKIPAAVTYNNLTIYGNPAYTYDTVNSLETLQGSAPYSVVVTGGTGWIKGFFSLGDPGFNFNTGAPDGFQYLRTINPAIQTASISGGEYVPSWATSGRHEVSRVNFNADTAGSSNSSYFIIGDSDGTVGVYLNNGSGIPPTGVTRTLSVSYSNGSSAATIATAVKAALEADGKWWIVQPSSSYVDIADKLSGARTDVSFTGSGISAVQTMIQGN